MVKKLKMMLAAAALLTSAAWAGRELDNRQGVFNGDYMAQEIKVKAPDKEDAIMEKTGITLENRLLWINLPDAKREKCRLDQIFSTGAYTDITAHSLDGDNRYYIRLDRSIER